MTNATTTPTRATVPYVSRAGARRVVVLATLLSFPLSTWTLQAQQFPRATPETVGMSSEGLGRLSDALEGYVAEGRLPGGVTMVLRRGNVVFAEAYGARDREAADPMAVDDIFRIASHTKAVVSVAAMILVEEGTLSLDDPISRFLPAFEGSTVAVATGAGAYDVVPAASPITVRHLLTHTSGLSLGGGPAAARWAAAGFGNSWYLAHREEPIREAAAIMAGLPLQTQPGAEWNYSVGVDVLGAVVEAASALPLDRFLAERIFQPLRMVDTHFYLPPEKLDRFTVVYALRRGAPLERAPEGPGTATQGQYVTGPRALFSGGHGLLSTANDYARFLQMLLNGGELDGVRILRPETVRAMTTNQVGDLYRQGEVYWEAGTGFGLGFRVRLEAPAAGGPGSVGEFGWLGAYHSYYWVDPVEQLVVVHLTQTAPATGLDDERRVRELVYAAIPARAGN